MSLIVLLMQRLWEKYFPAYPPYRQYIPAREARRILRALIREKMEFALEDFRWLEELCGLMKWIQQGKEERWADYLEQIYSTAVKCRNQSAQESFLFWRKRPELLTLDRKGQELEPIYVGRLFVWDSEWVKCTSFNEQHRFITVVPDLNPKIHKRVQWDKLQTRAVASEEIDE